jgi:hypothetical protein
MRVGKVSIFLDEDTYTCSYKHVCFGLNNSEVYSMHVPVYSKGLAFAFIFKKSS